MRIAGGGDTRGVTRPAGKQQNAKSNGAGFASHLSEPASSSGPEQSSGAPSIAALLAVQAAGDTLDGRRQAYDRAESMLKRLDALRVALLEGRISDDALRRLAADLEADSGAPDDPMLAEAIAEIELRAQVELAKRNLI